MTIFRRFHHLYFLIPIITYGLLYFILTQAQFSMNQDVTLFLEIGNRILDGQMPYVDFYEINFPTIQYISAIFAFISRLTGTNMITMTLIIMWILIGWSSLSLYFLIKRMTDDIHLPYVVPTILIVYSTAIQIPLLARPEFAQREHIFVILFLPFLFIRIHQWSIEEKPSGLWWRFIYGFIAAIGVSIKPYFALVFVLIELYGFSQHRDWKRILRAEIFGFTCLAILHTLYFVIFPDVLQGFLDLLRFGSQYLQFMSGGDATSGSLRELLNWIGVAESRDTLFLVALVWLLTSSMRKTSVIVRVLCIFTASGVLTFSLQSGFLYHSIIYQFGVWVLILYVLARFFHPPHYDNESNYNLIQNPLAYIVLIITTSIFVIYLNVLIPRPTQVVENTPYQEFILKNTVEGESIFVFNNSLSRSPNLNFPDLYQINRRTSSPYLNHFPFTWAWGENTKIEERLEVTQPVMIQTWIDRVTNYINTNQPRMIVFNPPIHTYMDSIGFLDRVVFDNYELIKEESNFLAYMLVNN